MNVKKSLAVFAAILTAASAFAGCSSESTSTESTSAETTVSAADTAEDSEAEVSDDNNQELAYEYVDMTTGDMDMTKTFSGVFDGNGHTLSNYTYKNDGNQMAVGIFGAVTGTVKNLNVENADISGDTSAMATGGLIVGGSFTGSPDNCSAKGTVTAEGILKDCDEDMIRNSIELFCTENLAG